MASLIRPTRTEVSRTFAWLGFTIRTGGPASVEVALATDPALFEASARDRRTPGTFYSTHGAGPLPVPGGEMVWVVPQDVLARFSGKPRLYYALAVFRPGDRDHAELLRPVNEAAPAVKLSSSFTGVSRRLAGVGGAGGGGRHAGATDDPASLRWAGDAVAAPPIQPAAPRTPAGAPAAGQSAAFDYQDGLEDLEGPVQTMPAPNRTAVPLSAPFDVRWTDVQLVPQLTGVSCWAAAAAMVVGWRDRISIDPSEFARREGRWSEYDQTGLYTNDNDEFARAWRLVAEPPQDYTVDGFRALLERNGPLWVGRLVNGASGHAVCVYGLSGDGTPDGTFVHYHDPWPPAQGAAAQASTYRTFLTEFDGFASVDPSGRVNNQILHSGGTGGRVPTVTAQGYARPMQGPARAMDGGATAVAIAGAVISRILDNDGGVSWKLDQLSGFKKPANRDDQAGPATYQTTVITVPGPHAATVFGYDEIYADASITFQHNGRSVGNVQIAITNNSDALGAGLTVEAQIMDEANTFTSPGFSAPFAALKIRMHYRFTNWPHDDSIAITDLVIYGNGLFTEQFRWTQ